MAEPDPPLIRVRDVMTPSLREISATATVREAIDIFKSSGVSSLIIPRGGEADELGLITVRDIATEVIAEGRSPDRVYVYEVMRKPVLTVDAEMDVRFAVRLLTRFGLSRAVVIGGEREPVGLVTLRDMVMGHASGAQAS
jgi:signal-transduction protein with cAMP-binding, CBS, and nucleotidyltransferase domain